MEEILFDFQKKAVDQNVKSLRKYSKSISADAPGAGKTYICLAAAQRLGYKIFVITVKSTIYTFFSLADQYGIEVVGVTNYELLQRGKYYTTLGCYNSEEPSEDLIELIKVQDIDPVTRKPLFKKNGDPKMILVNVIWKLPPKTLIIYDEVHKCKTGLAKSKKSTANNKIFVTLKPHITRPNLELKLMMMSATITDRIDCLDGICYIMGLINDYSGDAFREFKNKLGTEEKALAMLNKAFYPEFGSRTPESDLRQFYNEVSIGLKYLNLTPEDFDLMDEIYGEIREIYNDIKSQGVTIGFGKIIKLWVRGEVILAKYIGKIIMDEIAKNRKPVVFVNFTDTIKAILSIFDRSEKPEERSLRYLILDGKTKDSDETIRKFQNNEVDFMITNINKGGTSISLHDKDGGYPRSAIILPSWNSISIMQTLGRIHRVGGKSKAEQYIVMVGNNPISRPSSSNEDTDEANNFQIVIKSMLEKINYINIMNNETRKF